MSFPTTSVLDSFNRADAGPPPSASWEVFSTGWKVVSNQCVSSISGAAMFWATLFGADVESFFTYISGNGFAVFLRYDNAIGNAYFVYVSGSFYELFRRDTGFIDTQIASYDNIVNFVSGDKIGISALGSKIGTWLKPIGNVWRNTNLITDSTYNANKDIVYYADDATATIDDFGGGVTTASLVFPGIMTTRTGWWGDL